MAFLKSSPSSSSFVPARRWAYDVFISFRGKDTRNTFVDHLYSTLLQRGINVFKDDKALEKGKPITPELLKAIEESRFAVVVFSKNYAESEWCLDELVKIMECQDSSKKMVFYHVDPSDVREQKKDYDTAFQKHEEKFGGEVEKLNKWRNALQEAGNLSGWHVMETGNRGESAIIREIAEGISSGIQPRYTEKNLIGIDARIDELYSLLCMEETEEVRMVGILGMGGIGKTTIANALFRRIAHNFEGSSFVEDIRHNGSSRRDIYSLQQKILRDILGIHQTDPFANKHIVDPSENPEYGAEMIQERFFNKKVFVVLDNVDDVEQLEFLAARHNWFGPGSRIIITTRDEKLLSDVNEKYRPDFLPLNEAIELFSMHAFRKSSPTEGYEERSYRAVCYAGCLPLALKVLGEFFHGISDVRVWENGFSRLEKSSDNKILETLKLSFDGLHAYEKKIFLDIACFFKGKDEEHVTRVLDSFGFDPVIGMNVLIQKSLITISNQTIDMHDLIQEMGLQIVRQNFPNSRLWQVEQLLDLIMGNKKRKEVEAITLIDNNYHADDYIAKLDLSSDVFASMENLRLLDIDRKFNFSQPIHFPHELRWLCWNEYPFLYLPLADMCKLVGLELAKGNIQHLWKGEKILPHLKFIHLESLRKLTTFPDISGAPNLRRIILSDCKKLVKVHKSLGSHKSLVYLDLNGCSKLKCLPSIIEMEALEILVLSRCGSLEIFPEVSPCMIKLSQINLNSCSGIKELPSSIRNLSSLSFLNLTNCINLERIPKSICELENIKCLHLENCVKLKYFPNELEGMKRLEDLRLGLVDVKSGKPLKFVDVHSLTSLCSLRKLDLSWREIQEESFPKDLDALSSLEELYLSGNRMLVHLPEIIGRLFRLKRLEVNKCRQLRSLCKLPSNIQVLKANDCASLENIGDLSKECEWLSKIWLLQCQKLLEDEDNQIYLGRMLQLSFIKKCAALNHRLAIIVPGSKIPSWFERKKPGCRIALKLPPKWHTEVMGFVLCGVFHGDWLGAIPRITFRIVSDEKVILESEVDYMKNAFRKIENGNLWISYMPLGFFQQMYHDLVLEDWSHIEGSLDITVELTNTQQSVTCGAHVIYKGEVEFLKDITTSIPDYGTMMHVDNENLGYNEVISGNTYVYEEKSEKKSLMPSRSRMSTRHDTKRICCLEVECQQDTIQREYVVS